MIKTLAFVLCTIFCVNTLAQDNAFLYLSVEDFNNQMAVEAVVDVEYKNIRDCIFSSSTDDTLNQDLIDVFMLVEYHDSLFVNNYLTINRKHYGKVYYINDSLILYTAPYTDLKGVDEEASGLTAVVAGGMAAGPVGAALVGLTNSSGRYNYALHRRTGEVKMITHTFMKRLMGRKHQIFKRYKKDHHKFEPDYIIQYMEAYFNHTDFKHPPSAIIANNKK